MIIYYYIQQNEILQKYYKNIKLILHFLETIDFFNKMLDTNSILNKKRKTF